MTEYSPKITTYNDQLITQVDMQDERPYRKNSQRYMSLKFGSIATQSP